MGAYKSYLISKNLSNLEMRPHKIVMKNYDKIESIVPNEEQLAFLSTHWTPVLLHSLQLIVDKQSSVDPVNVPDFAMMLNQTKKLKFDFVGGEMPKYCPLSEKDVDERVKMPGLPIVGGLGVVSANFSKLLENKVEKKFPVVPVALHNFGIRTFLTHKVGSDGTLMPLAIAPRNLHVSKHVSKGFLTTTLPSIAQSLKFKRSCGMVEAMRKVFQNPSLMQLLDSLPDAKLGPTLVDVGGDIQEVNGIKLVDMPLNSLVNMYSTVWDGLGTKRKNFLKLSDTGSTSANATLKFIPCVIILLGIHSP